MKHSLLIVLAVAAGSLSIGYMSGYGIGYDKGVQHQMRPADVFPASINSFDDCVIAGLPVQESHPRRCIDPTTRKVYVEELGTTMSTSTDSQVVTSTPEVSEPACVVGGCSGQICGESGAMENLVSTCEFRAEYACYRYSNCERQSNGECGWTQNTKLMECLAHPPTP